MSDATKTMSKQLQQIYNWTIKPLAYIKSGKPYLSREDGILKLHFDYFSVQSEMDVDLPDELLLSYTRVMMSFLLLNTDPQRIAIIGLGGGSLAKYCYRYLPDASIIVVEINPHVIELRNEFFIPQDDARFHIVSGDGADFVAAPDRDLQVLMVDGFDAAGQSSQLRSVRFYENCFSSLADDGILVVNLWSSSSHCEINITRIKNIFSDQVAIISLHDSLNKIVFAVKSKQGFPLPNVIRRNANLLSISHKLNFREKSVKLLDALRSGKN